MSSDSSAVPLSDLEFQRLQGFADRFAATRAQGNVSDWEPFLPPAGDRLRRHVLIELAKLDLELTWREGGRVLAETYETLFPELSPAPIDLIVEEYRTRQRHGDKPGLEEYQRRFPDRVAEIEGMVRAGSEPTKPRADEAPKALKENDPIERNEVEAFFPPGYTPIERIGKGNFGEVWRAEAPGGIAVAIKIVTQSLDHEAAKKEQAALELVKRLQHPKLLTTFAYWIIHNRLVIAMELADGTLRDRLRQCRANGLPGIPPDELLPYFRDAAEALDWLHWQGVLHRDIKPENILLKHGYAKVGDFGLAKAGQSDVMVSASLAGTPAFMAPEVWGQKAGKASDQYSLAFTYAELRLGRRPLGGNDFVSVMRNALEGTPDLRGLPDAEQNILRRALAKSPEERFGSCVEFVDALEAAVFPDRQNRRRLVPSSSESQINSNLKTSRANTPIANASQTVTLTQPPQLLETSVSGSLGTDPVVWRPPGTTTPNKRLSIVIPVMIVAGLAVVIVGALFILFRGKDTEAPFSTGAKGPPGRTNQSGEGEDHEKKSSNVIVNDVPKLPEKPLVPPGFEAVPSTAWIAFGERKWAERVVHKHVGRGGLTLRLLQPPNGKPFYILENKLDNGIVQQYLEENPGILTRWRNDGPSLPAVNLTWLESVAISRWLKGELPTAEQWDFAAGWSRREGRQGPFQNARRNLGIRQSRLLPVDREHDDVSPFGIRDMSGNGREWTRTTTRLNNEEFAVLRGRLFTMSEPLTYDDLARQHDPQNAILQRTAVPSPYTGFRIVIEIE